MTDETNVEQSTRRGYVRCSGAIVGGALLAGCLDDGEPYPEIPREERLFDRKRVADAITATQ